MAGAGVEGLGRLAVERSAPGARSLTLDWPRFSSVLQWRHRLSTWSHPLESFIRPAQSILGVGRDVAARSFTCPTTQTELN